MRTVSGNYTKADILALIMDHIPTDKKYWEKYIDGLLTLLTKGGTWFWPNANWRITKVDEDSFTLETF